MVREADARARQGLGSNARRRSAEDEIVGTNLSVARVGPSLVTDLGAYFAGGVLGRRYST